MWVLLLHLGLGSALLRPGCATTPAPSSAPTAPTAPTAAAAGCAADCGSRLGGAARARAAAGADVRLGCPAAGGRLGGLRAVHWRYGGGGAAVCSWAGDAARCSPRYGQRAGLAAPGPDAALTLRRLRAADGGTYTCLLLGEHDCACWEVTLSVEDSPCGTGPCSGGRRAARPALLVLLLLVFLSAALRLP